MMLDLTMDEMTALRDAAIDGSVAGALFHWDRDREEVLRLAVGKLRREIREDPMHAADEAVHHAR
jgi:hypothetical protein